MATLAPLNNDAQLVQSICAAVVKGSWKNLLRSKIGSNLTTTTVHQVLLQLSLYSNSPSLSWAFFKWIESSIPYYKHSLQSSWTMIHILTKYKHFKSAQSVVEKIAYKDFLSTQSVLSALVRLHDDPDVNSHVCSWLVIVYANSKMTQEALQVLEHMRIHGFRPHLHACTVLLNSLVKERLTDMGMHYEALCIQDRMDRGQISPDIVTYNSLIYGFCREGRMREALRLFREIKNATPNHVTYTTLIDGYCRVNDLDEALRLREVMEAQGLYPTVVTYNSILRKLCEEGRIRDANKLLNEMNERKIEPDNVTCNTLINAYCKIGDVKSALKVKDRMVDAGLKLDKFTYKALIHGFCKIKEMDSAKELLFSMLHAGFSPSYHTYSWLVDGYCDQHKEEAVIKLPDEFVRSGLCADISLYRALIRRLCKREKVDCAQRIFSLMQEKGILADSVIHTSLAYAYWKIGKANAASDLLDEMYRRRLMITVKIYRCFNASYAGDKSILNLFWNLMVGRRIMSKNILKDMQ
ncbi:hypothetical protein GH714_012956 [Hevea brasiliensis]|uniref:Pentacotripeptide-repeat region of PRORP domain-containing protein n=1 Tax=Hevea brasiliensis TaxID=3981 RepID=A0A6A6MIZ1_HEVBR|nr:hypothetical protein GH714_012956 [Hevea brasiliensis]